MIVMKQTKKVRERDKVEKKRKNEKICSTGRNNPLSTTDEYARENCSQLEPQHRPGGSSMPHMRSIKCTPCWFVAAWYSVTQNVVPGVVQLSRGTHIHTQTQTQRKVQLLLRILSTEFTQKNYQKLFISSNRFLFQHIITELKFY